MYCQRNEYDEDDILAIENDSEQVWENKKKQKLNNIEIREKCIRNESKNKSCEKNTPGKKYFAKKNLVWFMGHELYKQKEVFSQMCIYMTHKESYCCHKQLL